MRLESRGRETRDWIEQMSWFGHHKLRKSIYIHNRNGFPKQHLGVWSSIVLPLFNIAGRPRARCGASRRRVFVCVFQPALEELYVENPYEGHYLLLGYIFSDEQESNYRRLIPCNGNLKKDSRSNSNSD